jgi:N-acetylmuramoyl-L-alanine amidase
MSKIIFIDPGHGGIEPGAVQNELTEKDLNLSISLLLKNYLVKLGFKTIMSRTSDLTLSLTDRVKMANNSQANVFISVHCNSFPNKNAFGFEIWHYGSEQGIMLANSVYNAVINKVDLYGRGIKRNNFYVLQHTKQPAILIECGFMSNPSEAKKLNNKEFQEQLANSIAHGIWKYFN